MAAANITGQGRTPPARRAVSFALGGQWVGGPQSGWVRTDFLQKLVAPRIGRDLDIQAERSISGAAFAAAMGAQTRFFELFFSLTNFRLGAWLPNPYFVALKVKNLDDWTVPGLPDRRRLDHWVRELSASIPARPGCCCAPTAVTTTTSA